MPKDKEGKTAVGWRRGRKRVKRSALVRAINFIGPALSKCGIGRIELDPDSLEERARQQTGFSDFGNCDYRGGLEKFVESLHCDGKLHHLGKTAMRDLLTLRLSTRLKTTDFLRMHPDLEKSPSLRAPVFVIGTMRSGTTLLFNLLAQDSRFRATELWETLDPIPPKFAASPENIQHRIDAMQEMLGPYNNLLPELRQVHSLQDARQVEEDHGLLEPTFRSGAWAFLLWNGASYYTWLMEQPIDEHTTAIQEYAQTASILMHGHDGKTWLSKAPLEAPLLPAIVRVFPDARIIHTHRDPRARIPSTASLLKTFHSMYTDPDLHAIGKQVLAYDRFAKQGIAVAARSVSSDNIVHIDYDDLVREPICCVEHVYGHFGMRITPEHRSRMGVWQKEKNQYDPKRAGRHAYDSRDFGLDDDVLATLTP